MLINMLTQPSAIAKINELSGQFWLKESELLILRMQDETLHKVAMEELSAQQVKPVAHRDSLERIGARAERSRTIFQGDFSRKGGRAAKTDALQLLIIEIVRGQTDVTGRELLRKLREMAKEGHEVVIRIDEKPQLLCDQAPQVHFKGRGTDKTAPVSGLKDRLSRAKKKIVSR
jgi:hypothetical protein